MLKRPQRKYPPQSGRSQKRRREIETEAVTINSECLELGFCLPHGQFTIKNEEYLDDAVKWAKEKADDDGDNSDFAYIATNDAVSLKRTFDNTAYIHGMNSTSSMEEAIAVMHYQLRQGPDTVFDGIKLETTANRRSVMRRMQYEAYQRELFLRISIKSAERHLECILGASAVIGTARIQIPFSALRMIIDVEFEIIDEDVTSLLTIRDMIDNGLDISLQERYLHVGKLRQPLTLEKYFLV